MKKILYLGITLFFTFSTFSQEWQILDDNDEFKLFIRNHTKESAWVKWEYKKLKTKKYILREEQKIKKSLILFKCDCDKKMIGTMAEIDYDESGEVVNSKDKGDYANMTNVIPESIGELITIKFCQLNN